MALFHGGNDKVLLCLLPLHRDSLTEFREVFDGMRLAQPRREFFSQRRHRHGAVRELLLVGIGSHRMPAVAEQVPVEQQAEAIVRVPTAVGRVGPFGARAGLEDQRVVRIARLEDNLHRVGLAHPAGNDAQAALERPRGGVLQPCLFGRQLFAPAAPAVAAGNDEVL